MTAPQQPDEHPFTTATRALMDGIQRAGFPPLYQLPPEQARLSYRLGVGSMSLPLRDLARVEDFRIPGPAGDVPARLWADTTAPGQPVLLYLHGGGFVVGGIDTCEAMCRDIAHHSGAAVVAIDYRLAPEHKYPAGLHDGMAALAWLHEHGGTLGLDTRRLAVGGDSAGGTLASVLALHARNEGIGIGRRHGSAARHQFRCGYRFPAGSHPKGSNGNQQQSHDGHHTPPRVSLTSHRPSDAIPTSLCIGH